MGLENIKNIQKISDLDNIDSLNKNLVLCLIIKNSRFDLLKDANLRLDINDNSSLEELIDLILTDEDIFYYMNKNGFNFSNLERNTIFNIVFNKYRYSYELDKFFRNFFESKEELNEFIGTNSDFFRDYINIKNENISYRLKDCDNFITLVLEEGKTNLISNIQNYSIENLRLLVQLLNKNIQLPYYIGNNEFAEHIIKLKDELKDEEMIVLLNLLKDRAFYDRKMRDSESTSFENLVKNNTNYLINIVTNTKTVPNCLAESSEFRDECINKDRIDIASKCIIPSNLLENESLVDKYCNELHIDKKIFYERYKWICNYFEKNNNIFNIMLASSLKNNIFSLNSEHFERFINDVDVQLSLSKLSERELSLFSKILDLYSYDEYDISQMIVNVINNMNDYKDLLNSINIEELNKQDIRNLVGLFQLPNNQYNITDKEELQKYFDIRKNYFEQNFNSNILEENKNNLLKVMFNIDLKEAEYIDNKYNHNNVNENILINLKNSELPENIYNLLLTLNKIIECNNREELIEIYKNITINDLYKNEIPLESYLRGQYTKLYSMSLYRIEEKNKLYGPKDNYMSSYNYKGKNVPICVPRVNFNFFIHCVGSCSLVSEVSSKNYRDDWLDRPQLQDHFIACSYINEKGIYSIRSNGSIIFGFDYLEDGSILAMGNCDIDSTGKYSCSYNGSRKLQEDNKNRAKFFVPSEILKTVNDGYNEIVIERRNMNKKKSCEFKRKPDYIIMMSESMESENFNSMNNLFQNQLSFISEEDRKQIENIEEKRKLKEFMKKYEDSISNLASSENIELNIMVNNIVNLIMKSKYFEDCLKASSEFDIPLVVIDKTYYFNKILIDSNNYDEEKIKSISDFYSHADDYTKAKLFNAVSKESDINQVMKQNEETSNKNWAL